MTNPKVTVLMSVYNGERFLERAIESILNQTYTDFEFIIINDGSTDSSRDIILSYKDERVRLLDQKNMGLSESLNRGIKEARGDYIARQDADDISYLERLEKQVEFLDKYKDYCMVGTTCEIINVSGKSLKVAYALIDDKRIQKGLLVTNQFCHGSVMIRRACLDKVDLYRGDNLYQDYELWLRISKAGKLHNLPHVLYKYRVHSQSVTYNSFNPFGDRSIRTNSTQSIQTRFFEDRLKEEISVPLKKENGSSEDPYCRGRDRRFSRILTYVGIEYYKRGLIKRARKEFLSAVKCHKYNILAYIFYLSSFFGNRVFSFVEEMFVILKNFLKKYLLEKRFLSSG